MIKETVSIEACLSRHSQLCTFSIISHSQHQYNPSTVTSPNKRYSILRVLQLSVFCFLRAELSSENRTVLHTDITFWRAAQWVISFIAALKNVAFFLMFSIVGYYSGEIVLVTSNTRYFPPCIGCMII